MELQIKQKGLIMVTIKIDEDTLLEILLDRVRIWTKNEDVIDLFEDYYKGVVNSGCFEGCKLDIKKIVDNDYINNMVVINKEDFEDWGIESFNDDKIEASNKILNLYLIRTY